MSVSEKIIKSPLRETGGTSWDGKSEIIDKSRVKENGEVLTPAWCVSDMLDMFSDKYGLDKGIDKGVLPLNKTILEPSIGTGNFAVQFIERKLRGISIDQPEIAIVRDIFTAVGTIYGVDVQYDNVLESRLRVLEVVEKWLQNVDIQKKTYILSELANILEENIVWGNTLIPCRGTVHNDGTHDMALKDENMLYFYEWDFSNLDIPCKDIHKYGVASKFGEDSTDTSIEKQAVDSMSMDMFTDLFKL
jgi:hypothetical protein